MSATETHEPSQATPAWGFRAFASTLSHHHGNRNWVLQAIDWVNARLDLADHRMLQLLKLRLTSHDLLPADLAEDIDEAILGFRYDLTEPGHDNMCTWTESHQLIFSTCELLAGQLFAQETFRNDGRTGRQKQDHARQLLLRWLDDRFHHGMSEWLSPVYYETVVAGLTMLVDHAEDQEIALRAAMVLDLLVLDLALHQFEGRFVAPGARLNREEKLEPDSAGLAVVMASAFGSPPRFDHEHLWAIFVVRERYAVPDVLVEIAHASGARQIRTSQGRDVAEAQLDVELATRGRSEAEAFERRVRTAWGQQAYLSPETVSLSLRAIERYGLTNNRFVVPLAELGRRVKSSELAQRVLLRTLNPVVQGICLHRANVFTYRTPNYLLTSVQHYRPGDFGDQQHLWQAQFPGGISVYSTHPGSTTLGEDARPATPSAWVGNGINPDIGQFNNVLLVLHDLRVRRGYLEGRRHERSHLVFPFARFDETVLTSRTLVGRIGTSLVGVAALERLELVSQTEVVQRGTVTGWALVASDLSEFSSLKAFSQAMKGATLRHARGAMVFALDHSNNSRVHSQRHEYKLQWQGQFSVDGVAQDTHYWRHDNDWVAASRNADLVLVQGRDKTLRLDWPHLRRDES